MGVKKRFLSIFLIAAFVLINTYLVYHLYLQFNRFKLRNFPIHIEVLRDNQPAYLNIIDINNDDIDEIVYSGSILHPGKRIFQIFEPYEYFYNFPFFFDITIPQNYGFLDAFYSSDYETYICRFLSYDEENNLFIKTVDNRQNFIEEIELDNPGYRYSERGAGIFYPQLVDFEDDGQKEIIIINKSYFINHPRGVICIDSVSGRLNWNFPTGAQVEDVTFIDINEDGKKEIILSTFACNNGAIANGTSDDKSYVIVLDSEGRIVWKTIVGQWYTRVKIDIFDLNHDGELEIIAGMENHRGGYDARGKLIIYDAQSGRILKEHIERNISFSAPVVRKKEKREPLIFVGDSLGSIRVLDKDLSELYRTKPLNKPIRVLGSYKQFQYMNFIYAITNDELIAYDLNLRKKVLDYKFQKDSSQGNFLPSSTLRFFNINNKKDTHAVLNAGKLYLLSDKNREFTALISDLFHSGFIFSFFALILFNIGAAIAFRKNMLISTRSNRYNNGETLAMVQELTHQVKNPVSTILWTAEKIIRNLKNIPDEKNRKDFDQLAGFLMDDVKNLKQYTKNIMQLLRIQNPVFEKTNIKELIRTITEQYKAILDKRIQFETDISEDIYVRIDKDLFKELLTNLIDNAINAIEDKGRIIISATPLMSPVRGITRDVMIEIEDTGTGMTQDEIDKAFTPFFTKQEGGTGLGLSICKRIVEAHKGKINIHSKKKFGTKIEVMIPVSKKEESE